MTDGRLAGVRDVAAGVAASHARLEFARDLRGLTSLARQHAEHPFHVTRPFRLVGDPDGLATLYLQSASGGIFRDDRLRLEVAARTGAMAHVTTAASTIVHDGRGGHAELEIGIEVGPHAYLEHLPEPLIMMPGADLRTRIVAKVAASGTLVLGEALVAHDPQELGRPFRRLAAEIRIERPDGGLIALDRLDILGGDLHRLRDAPGGPFGCVGLMLVVAPTPAAPLLEATRAALPVASSTYAGASCLPDGIGIALRVLAGDAVALTRALAAGWGACREAMTGRPPAVRRK